MNVMSHANYFGFGPNIMVNEISSKILCFNLLLSHSVRNIIPMQVYFISIFELCFLQFFLKFNRQS